MARNQETGNDLSTSQFLHWAGMPEFTGYIRVSKILTSSTQALRFFKGKDAIIPGITHVTKKHLFSCCEEDALALLQAAGGIPGKFNELEKRLPRHTAPLCGTELYYCGTRLLVSLWNASETLFARQNFGRFLGPKVLMTRTIQTPFLQIFLKITLAIDRDGL